MELLFSLREPLNAELRRLGYTSILLDLEGYRRGRLNEGVTTQPVTLHL
jgi:PP-loop superfamily ATP-utilizing enzyme